MSRLNPNEICVLCERESIGQVGVRVGKLTESYKIIFPEDNAEQSIQTTVPLCAYHLGFAEQGIIVYVKDQNHDGYFVPNRPEIENLNDTEIKKLIKKIKKDKAWKKDQSKWFNVSVGLAILSGRKALRFMNLSEEEKKKEVFK